MAVQYLIYTQKFTVTPLELSQMISAQNTIKTQWEKKDVSQTTLNSKLIPFAGIVKILFKVNTVNVLAVSASFIIGALLDMWNSAKGYEYSYLCDGIEGMQNVLNATHTFDKIEVTFGCLRVYDTADASEMHYIASNHGIVHAGWINGQRIPLD